MLNFFLGSPQQAEAHVQKTCFGKWARQTYRDSWASAAVDSGQPVNPEPKLQAKQGNSDSPHSFSWDKDEVPVAQHSQGKAVSRDTLGNLPVTWGCTPLDQSSLTGLCWHLVNMGSSQPIAEQCHPARCLVQRHVLSPRLQECLSYSREANNQTAMFSTQRHGHWKMPLWTSSSGVRTASPEAPKGRIRAKTSGTIIAWGSPGPGACPTCFVFP